jgi:hypothetical protein
MKSNPFIFSLKVWMTSVIVGSALILPLFPVDQPYYGNSPPSRPTAGAVFKGRLYLYLANLLYSFVCSISSYLIFLLLAWYLYVKYWTPTRVKIALSVAGSLLAFIPLFVFFAYTPPANLLYMYLAYILTGVAAVWFYKLPVL